MRTWKVYYVVQPYFFAHSHLHRRKVDTLRASGFDARILAFVPRYLLDKHKEQYQQAVATEFVEIVPVINEKATSKMVAWFILKQLLGGRRVLIHVLRNNPKWLVKLRKLPIIGKNLKLVLEYEGDQPEEFIYQQTVVDTHQVKINPNEKDLKTAQSLAEMQARLVKHVDGLVLMSEEHVKLWEQRVADLPLTAVVPSLHDPGSNGFSEGMRNARREELGWSDKLVLIYTGNVVSTWQRFSALCRFVAKLRQSLPDVRLLALVRKDDLSLANKVVVEEGLESATRILSVQSKDVASYLCAADFGLYLRHRHPMNLVVTSAKLGEYLACGLPVITTGANAEVLNSFIREVDAGIFLPEDLTVSSDFPKQLGELLERMQKPFNRQSMVDSFVDFFSEDRDPLVIYRDFILSLTETA